MGRAPYLYTFNPEGTFVQRQSTGPGGNTTTYALDTAFYDAFGLLGHDRDALAGGDSPRREPLGFGAQWGYYTDRDGSAAYDTQTALLGARYYDPGTGRFLTRDPLGYGGGQNLYGFAGNNPVNEIDPSGLAPEGGERGLVSEETAEWEETAEEFGAWERDRERELERERDAFFARGNRPIIRTQLPDLGDPPGAQYVAARSIMSYSALRGSEEVDTVVIRLQRSATPVGSETNKAARILARFIGKPADDAGHIQGNLLGGSGTAFTNLFPQDRGVNRGAYRVFEREVADNVLAGGDVTVRIQRRYQSTLDTRPYAILYQARVGGRTLKRLFNNP